MKPRDGDSVNIWTEKQGFGKMLLNIQKNMRKGNWVFSVLSQGILLEQKAFVFYLGNVLLFNTTLSLHLPNVTMEIYANERVKGILACS